MDEINREQADENVLQFDVSDEALEVAACAMKVDTLTQWLCPPCISARGRSFDPQRPRSSPPR